ncbi:MAG: amidohydrolase family protein, partial [Gammaproteobacteria bacterium]|nr:amidohydrolase family protein [Gammaproteobacteria bacterium]
MNQTDRYTVLRGARVLDAKTHRADLVDILVADGTIKALGEPGFTAPDKATIIDATDRLIIPGLINAHTHGHGALAKGSGDRWTLELLLNAGPWLSGNRSIEHKYLAALIGAMEMLRKGCTACYDLYFEIPKPRE